MQTAGIKPDDIIECEVRGYVFIARAVSRMTTNGSRRGIEIEPLREKQHLITSFVTARQIVGHYAKRKGSR